MQIWKDERDAMFKYCNALSWENIAFNINIEIINFDFTLHFASMYLSNLYDYDFSAGLVAWQWVRKKEEQKL